MLKPHDPRRIWLLQLWNANGRVLFDHLETKKLTGEQVREFMLEVADGQPLAQRWFRIHWKDCKPDVKQKSLENAFPDKEYLLEDDELGGA